MLKHMAFRFLASGAFNTLLTLGLYWLLLFALPPQVSYAVSFGAGIVLSYVLNLRYVFRERHSMRKMALFPLIYLLIYGMGATVLHLAIHRVGIPAAVAPLLSIACTVPVSFVLIRWLLADRLDARGNDLPPPPSPRN